MLLQPQPQPPTLSPIQALAFELQHASGFSNVRTVLDPGQGEHGVKVKVYRGLQFFLTIEWRPDHFTVIKEGVVSASFDGPDAYHCAYLVARRLLRGR